MNAKTVELVEKIEKVLHTTNVSFKSFARFYYVMFFVTSGILIFVITKEYTEFIFVSSMFVFACALLSLMGIVGQRQLNKHNI